MPTLSEISAQLTTKIGQPVSVVVARNAGRDGLEARKLNLADDAAAGFRELCRESVELLQDSAVVSYSADAELSQRQVFLLDDAESLTEMSDLRELVTQAATLPMTAPKNLDVSIQLYAVVVGSASRAAFVRRVDPHIKHKAGGFLAVAGTQLRRLEEPAFSFAPGFDLIVADQWVIVQNQVAFERLFREIGLVERHVAEWVRGITDHLSMEAKSVSVLREVALRDSRTWRRLREIRRRGHLAHVDLAQVRRYARNMGLDPKTIVRNNQLVFDPAERFSFLHLLNEDLYRGPLTEATFEAQRKAPTET